MQVLGIESSCDETGAAIYDTECGLLGHALYSQVALHDPFGGVVPELASRDHVRKIIPIVREALSKAQVTLADIQGVAYTAGPGLAGALLVGASFGRTLGHALNIPAVAVHHMEGHLLAPMLELNAPCFPFLALLVSGGHTQLVKVIELGHYEILGESLDDAVGEAFDKTAKLLGLGYPGGAALAKLAELGDANRFQFPRPMLDRPGLDFSFSGLKTAVVNVVNQHPVLDHQTRADIAASFQLAVVETLMAKCRRALQATGMKSLVVAGGVGANQLLRQSLQELADINVFFPRLEFCTDNGAMIAYVGAQYLLKNYANDLSIQVYPRWELFNSSN